MKNNWYFIGGIWILALIIGVYAIRFAPKDGPVQWIAWSLNIGLVTLYFILKDRYVKNQKKKKLENDLM